MIEIILKLKDILNKLEIILDTWVVKKIYLAITK